MYSYDLNDPFFGVSKRARNNDAVLWLHLVRGASEPLRSDPGAPLARLPFVRDAIKIGVRPSVALVAFDATAARSSTVHGFVVHGGPWNLASRTSEKSFQCELHRRGTIALDESPRGSHCLGRLDDRFGFVMGESRVRRSPSRSSFVIASWFIGGATSVPLRASIRRPSPRGAQTIHRGWLAFSGAIGTTALSVRASGKSSPAGAVGGGYQRNGMAAFTRRRYAAYASPNCSHMNCSSTRILKRNAATVGRRASAARTVPNLTTPPTSAASIHV